MDSPGDVSSGLTSVVAAGARSLLARLPLVPTSTTSIHHSVRHTTTRSVDPSSGRASE
jgi:hypothetical protein